MASTASLKLYIDKILQLQGKYGWMMDSYVLNFFTQDLWQKLPKNWINVLERLDPNEIAFYLLEIYSTTRKQKLKEFTFREVWPLELLAFVATCHSLNLQNQPWICKNNEARNHNDDQPCSNTEEDSQNMDLDHAFRCHIKPKKQYEIQVLSKMISKQAEQLQCRNIVDVGSGLGHLSRLLSYGHGLNVVTVEGDSCHKSGAEKLDKKLKKDLQKHAVQGQVDGPGQVTKGSLVHLTHHINADVSAEEFSSLILDGFKKQEECDVRSSETDSGMPCKKESSENFMIVGLHTCGDLASTLLRVFASCENVVGILSIGCCYMKLSHEPSGGEQSSTKQDMNAVSGCGPKTLGYPVSGYLKSCSSHRQSYNGLEAACHALGRYQKRLEECSPSLKLHYYRALLEILFQQKDPHGPRKQIRRLRTKKAAGMTFPEYVKTSWGILGLEDCPTQADISRVEELHRGKENHVVVFYVLRLLLAPLVEGLILADRLLYIKENDQLDIQAKISVLFDPDLSPRNMAIVAGKKNQVEEHSSGAR